MKRIRFDHLLASTALGLVLMLSGAQAQVQKDQNVPIIVPIPDDLPPPTLETLGPAAVQAAPAEAAKPVAAAPAPVAVTADSAVSDKLREMITGKLDRSFSRKNEREGVEAFYKARNYAAVYVNNGAANARAASVIAQLASADNAGLDPSDYPTPDFKSAATPDALADAELKLTAAALTYARHAQTGRISYTRVGSDVSFAPVAPEPADVLAKLADASDAGKALDAYNPPMAEFKALRDKLAELRKEATEPKAAKVEEKKAPPVKIADGKILRPGMKDPRVSALRKRLDIPGDKDNQLYDETVSEHVKAFQLASEIGVDGNLGPNTVKTLNGDKPAVARRPAANPIDTVIVNLDRWRWFPRDLGNPHVVVNVPDYSLTLWNDDKVYWHTKIVAGQPSKATPMISAEMKFITVNPTWNVPPSIIENEYLPALREDPQALERIGLKVEQAADGTVRIYQPPGAGNALGRIRFNFPNKFLVYQHDTPDKNLFKKDRRAFSHGCMRVENPLIYGEKLLSLALPSEHYTAARIEKMFGGSEININFPKNIWVHLTYQTAFVGEDGKLEFREDVYGRDARMISILKNERRVADIPVEQHGGSSSKPVRMPAGTFGGGYGGPSFFDMLFGGGRVQQPAPSRNSRNNNGRVSQR